MPRSASQPDVLASCRRPGTGRGGGAARVRGTGRGHRLRHVLVHGHVLRRAAGGTRRGLDRCLLGAGPADAIGTTTGSWPSPARARPRRSSRRSSAFGVAMPTLAITGDPVTAIVDAADAVVALEFADERSVVQTRFATTTLALLRASLGDDLGPVAGDAEQALGVPIEPLVAGHPGELPGPRLDDGSGPRGGAQAARGRPGVDRGVLRDRVPARTRERGRAGPGHLDVRQPARRAWRTPSARRAHRSCVTSRSTRWPRSSSRSAPPWAWPSQRGLDPDQPTRPDPIRHPRVTPA